MDFTLNPNPLHSSPANRFSVTDDNDYTGKFRIVEIASFPFTSVVQRKHCSHLDETVHRRVNQKKTNHNGFLLSSVCAPGVNMLESSFNLKLHFFIRSLPLSPLATLQIASIELLMLFFTI